MKLKTRVFDLANEKHISIPKLAQAMGISPSEVYRVRSGKRKTITEAFIIGAMNAFPECKFDDLFDVVPGKDGQRVYQIPKPKSPTKEKPRSEQMNAMLTAREISQLLHVHINTIRRWSNQGLLKAYRIGTRGDRRYRQEDITAFLKESKIWR